LWNAGLLLYQLVLAGFDCRNARLGTHGYNISVIVPNVDAELPTLAHDAGDIQRLAHFFPAPVAESFDGQMPDIAWNAPGAEREPAPTPPASVAIVAMGSSARQYILLCNQLGDRRRVAAETWAINSMGGAIQHDLLFHMDDCRVQEARATRDPTGNIAGMLGWLRTHPRFITSKAYPEDYPGAVEFPLQDVIRGTGNAYFNNTVAYAVAYAIHVGVKRIVLYGCDFSYPSLHKAESGRACVEFWMATAAARGIAIEVAAESTLFDANVPEDQRFYGYDAEHVRLEADGETGVKITRTPRDKLPTAEEIEQRYNHVPRATVA
jgi:hypothetical protein